MWLVLSLSSLFDGPCFLNLHWRSEILSRFLSHGIFPEARFLYAIGPRIS